LFKGSKIDHNVSTDCTTESIKASKEADFRLVSFRQYTGASALEGLHARPGTNVDVTLPKNIPNPKAPNFFINRTFKSFCSFWCFD